MGVLVGLFKLLIHVTAEGDARRIMKHPVVTLRGAPCYKIDLDPVSYRSNSKLSITTPSTEITNSYT